jgi:hypothetical protein
VLFQSCFLFPVNPIPDKPTPFTPSVVWVRDAIGPIMDVGADGSIMSVGDTSINLDYTIVAYTFNSDGLRIRYYVRPSIDGLPRQIINAGSIVLLSDYSSDGLYGTHNVSALLQIITNNFNYNRSSYTNTFTHYNTILGGPDVNPDAFGGNRYLAGPKIALGHIVPDSIVFFNGTDKFLTPSIWMVGTFTDRFSISRQNRAFTTFGNADCFITRCFKGYTPVYLQWGGAENDIAYDVKGDNTGNATVFLRAGSDFGVTSATQSIVHMKTGYNIVKLDTNGLLTSTFPVKIEAMGEITDAQIALGKNGNVFLLAKDEIRKQYFLTKITPSGTSWTRYFDPSTLGGVGLERMGFVTDSKENVYVTGTFSGVISPNDAPITGGTSGAFVSSYSTNNVARGATTFGSGVGVNVRLSPQEEALYVSGWAFGLIAGVDVRGGLPIYKGRGFVVKMALK